MSEKDSVKFTVSDIEDLSDTVATQSDAESAERDEPDREDVVKIKEKMCNPGIVYLSRIPPFMKPHKVRHIFSQYGAVGRVYLQPEGRHRLTDTVSIQPLLHCAGYMQ